MVETIRYFAEFVTPKEDITAVEDDPDDDKIPVAMISESRYISAVIESAD